MKIELTDREASLLRTLFEGHIAMADVGPEFFAISDKLVKAGVQKDSLTGVLQTSAQSMSCLSMNQIDKTRFGGSGFAGPSQITILRRSHIFA